jgi:hypothetical protein
MSTKAIASWVCLFEAAQCFVEAWSHMSVGWLLFGVFFIWLTTEVVTR